MRRLLFLSNKYKKEIRMDNYEVTLPQIINLVCPQCRLTWLNSNIEGHFYFCFACGIILLDRQVKELYELSKNKN